MQETTLQELVPSRNGSRHPIDINKHSFIQLKKMWARSILWVWITGRNYQHECTIWPLVLSRPLSNFDWLAAVWLSPMPKRFSERKGEENTKQTDPCHDRSELSFCEHALFSDWVVQETTLQEAVPSKEWKLAYHRHRHRFLDSTSLLGRKKKERIFSHLS